MLLEQVSVNLLRLCLLIDKVGVEISMRIFQVVKNLAEAVQFASDIHKAVTFLLDNLHDMVGEDIQVRP